MRMFIRFFYIFWLLSLPFYSFSIVGTLSLDNLLAPIILGLSIVKYVFISKPNKRKNNIIISSLVLYALFCTGYLLSVSSNAVFLHEVSIILLKYFVYLFIPVFYIQNRSDLRHTIYSLLVITSIGCISVFLVSIGILELSISRTSPGRISALEIPKSIGLFGNYGDLAILISVSVAFTRIITERLRNAKRQSISAVTYSIIVIGYLGAQSRNIIVTFLFSTLVYLYFKSTIKRGTSTSVLGIMVLSLIFIPILTIFILTDYNPLEAISAWGGSQAKTTATDRLSQYSFAWSLIMDSPVIGDGISVLRNGIQIHNIWLNVISSGGIVSLVALVGLFIFALINTVRNINYRTDALAISVNAAIIAALLMASEFYVGLTYVFFLIFGVAIILPITYTNHSKITKRAKSP